MNIIKEGVRGAFVRIIRIIVYCIILFVIFFIIGLFTSKKASALTYKGQLWEPNLNQNLQQGYVFGPGNATHWYHWDFTSNWYNNTDYDLLGFKFNRITGVVQDQSNFNNKIEDFYTLQGILWTSGNYGVPCYASGEWLDTFFCPISKGETYHAFSLIANAFDPIIYLNLELQVELERNRIFANYGTTDIITYFEGSGGLGNMVVEQQTTNTIIQQQTTYITDNSTTGTQTDSTNALNGISSDFNDVLNGWGGQWSSLTHIILEPLNVILYGLDTNTTCSPIRLTIPYISDGQYIDLPCMSGIYNTYFSSFITVFMSIMAGLYSYRTIMYIIRTFKDLLDAESDKIEVIDL